MGLKYLGTIHATSYTGNNVKSGFMLPFGWILVQCKATDIGLKFSNSPSANANPNDPDTLVVPASQSFEVKVDADLPVLAVASVVEETFDVSVFQLT